MKTLKIIFVLFLFAFANLLSQGLPGIRIGAGISTFSIAGDNANVWPLYPRDVENLRHGANYSGPQLGYSLKLFVPIDSSNQLFYDNIYSELDTNSTKSEIRKYNEMGDDRIVLGLNFYNFEGQQAIPDGFYRYYFTHKHKILNFELGLEKNIFKISAAHSQIFVGGNLLFTYISESEQKINVMKYDTDLRREVPENDITNAQNIALDKMKKGSAFRIGALGKIGIEGHIVPNITLNASWGIAWLNINKDDKRGELFTHNSTMVMNEYKESNVISYIFSLLLKYRL